MHKQIFLLAVLVAVLFESIADILFRFSYLKHHPYMLWIGFGIYTISTILWAISLKYEFLSKAISIFTVVNLIIVSLVGLVVFKEEVSTIARFGIALGVVAVALMQF